MDTKFGDAYRQRLSSAEFSLNDGFSRITTSRRVFPLVMNVLTGSRSDELNHG